MFQELSRLAESVECASPGEFTIRGGMAAAPGDCPIHPAFPEGNAAFLFCCGANYAPYLGVALRSIREWSNPSGNYDVIVVASGLTSDAKSRLRRCAGDGGNFSLRFVSLHDDAERAFSALPIRDHIQAPTYYRLLAPALLRRHDRIVYLDSDLVALADVRELYDADLSGRRLAACRDTAFNAMNKKNARVLDYAANARERDGASGYFNAGVLVMDLAGMRRDGFAAALDAALAHNPQPFYHDQDLLNMVYGDNVTYLSPEWNDCAWNILCAGEDVRRRIGPNVGLAGENAKILHFPSNIKPWTHPDAALADAFWRPARRTPFYETLLYRLNEYKLRLGEALIPK